MLKAKEMKVQRKIVAKTKIDRIRCQSINDWAQRIRRREWDERVTRMDAARLVKI